MPPCHDIWQRDDQPHTALPHPLATRGEHRRQIGLALYRGFERRAPLMHQVRQGEHQPLGAIIQPLPRAADQRGEVRQPAFRPRQPQPALLRQSVQPANQARRLMLQVGDKVRPASAPQVPPPRSA